MSNRALLIAFHFPPQAASSGIQRTLSFSRHLSSHNWEPIVLSASPAAYSQKNPSQLASVPEYLIVKRAFSLDTKRHLGILGRYPELLALPDRWSSWWLSAIPVGLLLIRKYRPNVIWSTFPIATSHLIGLTLHRITGIPWIADFRDPMVQKDYPTTSLQRKTYKWIENQAMKHCRCAIFTTRSAMESYRRRFPELPEEKFALVENGYDEDAFINLNNGDLPTEGPQKKAVTLLHSGVLYADGRDPTALFEAVSTLKAHSDEATTALRIILRATGDDEYFKTLVRKFHLEDIVSVEPPIPYRDALREMLTVDGLIVFQGTPFNTQVPAKIYEYFRARKPILGLVDPNGETAKVLESAGFMHMAPIQSGQMIRETLKKFVSEVQNGVGHVASDDLIIASSRRGRARELAHIFDRAGSFSKRTNAA